MQFVATVKVSIQVILLIQMAKWCQVPINYILLNTIVNIVSQIYIYINQMHSENEIVFYFTIRMGFGGPNVGKVN